MTSASVSAFVDEEPLRAELFTAERLSEEAKRLARVQKLSPAKPDLKLLKRVQDNSQYLSRIYSEISTAISKGESFPPAEHWLYDNFHFVEEQLRNVHEDLPRHFYQELPALASGPSAGLPRVYEMATQVIAHTDSRLSMPLLKQYIQTFQEISPLTTGELWGFAILLRISLIENLRRLVQHAEVDRRAGEEANLLADRVLNNPSAFVELPPQLEKPHLSRIERSFAAQFVARLRDAGPAGLPVLNPVMERVLQAGLQLEEWMREKHQDLAASQISVSNTMTSLRLLAGTDWSKIVEETSLVDDRLRKDPSGFYSKCN
jgi:cyclic beta-1,2-glucan glucanotransferase